jgi:hypothetical protein
LILAVIDFSLLIVHNILNYSNHFESLIQDNSKHTIFRTHIYDIHITRHPDIMISPIALLILLTATLAFAAPVPELKTPAAIFEREIHHGAYYSCPGT